MFNLCTHFLNASFEIFQCMLNATRRQDYEDALIAADDTTKAIDTSSSLSPNLCDLYAWVIHGLLMGIVCIFGLVGNSVSFIVFCRDPMKSSTHFLLQTLAVVDSALLITAILLFAAPAFLAVSFPSFSQLYGDSIYPVAVVYVYPFASIAQTITVWLTVLIGLNRYVAVCRPYEAYRLCSLPKTRRYLCFIVLASVIYNIPRFFNNELKSEVAPNDNLASQGSQTVSARHVYRVNQSSLHESWFYRVFYMNILYTIFMLLMPLLILCLLNIFLVRALSAIKQKRFSMLLQEPRGCSTSSSQQKHKPYHQQRHDNSITLMLIIVIVVFVICQSPALITQLLWSFLPNSPGSLEHYCVNVTATFYLRHVTNLLVTINSAVNVIIYMTCNSRFRHAIISACAHYKTPQSQGSNSTCYATVRMRALSNQTESRATAL